MRKGSRGRALWPACFLQPQISGALRRDPWAQVSQTNRAASLPLFFPLILGRNNSNSAFACNGVRSMSRALAVFQNCNSYWRYYCICNCCGALQPHFFFVFRGAIVGAAIFAMQLLLRFCQHCNCSLGDSCECKRCGGSVCTCGSPSKSSGR